MYIYKERERERDIHIYIYRHVFSEVAVLAGPTHAGKLHEYKGLVLKAKHKGHSFDQKLTGFCTIKGYSPP